MSDVVIKVENLSKRYRLGQVSTGTFAHDVNRWWAKLRGKPDPYTKVTETNIRDHKGSSEFVWALKDINFEVKRGEVLGIIGRNGAGKSTLLKILSRVTAPTEGQIKIKGRIGALLEVGTGFHPELTGRENIYLNGAILGMTKAEIASRFDEIVEFSGCERYIDTPVKRYSSGMMVRLGFAVAAHLEPEILIVDEVLAVGDAEFQKKCLGKMQDVATHGRTVLFVSHNMMSIRGLCTSGMLIENGGMACAMDDIDDIVSIYISGTSEKCSSLWKNNGIVVGTSQFNLEKVAIFQDGLVTTDGKVRRDLPIEIEMEFTIEDIESRVAVGFALRDSREEILFTSFHTDDRPELWPRLQSGRNRLHAIIPPWILKQGRYRVEPRVVLAMTEWLVGPISAEPSVNFEIVGPVSNSPLYTESRVYPLSPILSWHLLGLVESGV